MASGAAQHFAIDKNAFFRRARHLYSTWRNAPSDELGSLSRCDAVAVMIGQELDAVYYKSSSLLTWFFGVDFVADICFVFCRKEILILSSKKKIDFMKTIESTKENEEGVPPITLLVRDKTDKDAANYEKLLAAIERSGSGKTVGYFKKDEFDGEFAAEWAKRFKAKAFELVDVTASFGFVMAPKDEMEIGLLKKASDISSELFSKYLKEEITEIIDSDRKVKHERLADGLEKAAGNKKYIRNVDPSNVELCYPAIIQSGGRYNLKFSANSDNHLLHFGVITCNFGVRYRQYCSNIGRTFLVNPNEEQKKLYELLLSAEEAVIGALRPGTQFSEVYEKAAAVVAKHDRKLLDKFTKNCGFVMGIEFREASLQLAPKNSAVVRKGMCFNVALGFTNLENRDANDDESKTYALYLSDTVVVREDQTEVLTNAKKKIKNVSIVFRDEEEDEDAKEDEEAAQRVEEVMNDATRNRRTALLDAKLRSEPTNDEKRKRHQRELAEQLNEAAKARLAKGGQNKNEEKSRRSNVSYKNPSQMPREREIQELKLYVDKRFETVILPIYGIPVPFHISTIKNISQSIEGDYTYLRINFFTPGTTISKAESAMFASSADCTFLKELTYRSTNLKEAGEISAPCSNLNTAFRLIKEVQKKFKTREAEEREKEGIVKQDTLILSSSKANPKLKDLYIRPNIMTKRIHGTLEAHVNGFRFTSIRGDKLDIMYNNIKHAFFQPCDSEMLILLHFHLKNPIMFGKKKQTDVQFYTEVGEITTDLGKHQHMHDRDDLAAEQAEREMRNKLKTAFKSFCEKVEAMTKNDVDFETPFRELGFHGVPYRSNVFLQPTSTCLVNLTEWPPFVITLEDLEKVHFERVQFHLKNFDMVFIFKDYYHKVVMVNSIDMHSLDSVKEWLNSCDIHYTEGIQSLNWTKIMKTITDDPESFFNDGGWSFLDTNEAEDDEGDEEVDEEDEVYNPDEGSEFSEEESESDYSSEDDASEEDDSEENSLSSSEESGKDWSELEEEAMQADRNRSEFVDDYTSKKNKALEKEKGFKRRREEERNNSHHHRNHHKSPKKRHHSSDRHNGHSSGGSSKKMKKSHHR